MENNSNKIQLLLVATINNKNGRNIKRLNPKFNLSEP